MRLSRRIVTTAMATGLLVGLGACDGGEPEASSTQEPVTSGATTEPVEAVSLAPGMTIPGTRAGEATTWVLDQLAAAEGPVAEEAQDRFAEVFLAQVPAEQLGVVFDQLRAGSPYVAESYEGTEDAAQVALQGASDRFRLHVVTDPDGRMTTLFFEAARAVPDVSSLADLEGAVADLGVDASLLVAAGAHCEAVHAREADVARPIGSIIKLYVLDAVREAVADGSLAWDDTLTLTEDLRSLPSGVLQEEPAGHEVSVREAAELMISISDNTATDLLISAVGRDAVLGAVERLGHHDPGLLTPLVTTRELFQLAFTDPALREQWSTADAREREQILADLPGGAIEIDPARAQEVAWTQGVDWFATAEDLCRAHVGLQETQDEVVSNILALNPGIEVPAGWDYVAFKGGSAPGELAGSWYAESADGDQYVVVLQLAAADVAAVPDGGWLAGVVSQAFDVLDEEG